MSDRTYRSLYLIRRVEEEIARIYPSDKIMSPVHLSIGQEAVSVGVCEALNSDDIVFGSYRSHALYLAKGGDLNRMIAELYGKEAGCAKGKAGSMHLIDVRVGVMGASAVVATHIPQAVGYAWALKQRGSKALVACFFGDGAAEEGVFHESLNYAALKQVPIMFVCENNTYAIHSKQKDRQNAANICDLARSHGIPASRIEDMDVKEIRRQSAKAAEEIRRGSAGPVFLECMCYRWMEHVGPNLDFNFGYRSKADAEQWFRRDQVVEVGLTLPASRRIAIEAEVEADIKCAFEYAEQAAFPDERELYTDLFK
jgi:TPP-dependent pyruvate/acetoin dehydrogenase alpha subunit